MGAILSKNEFEVAGRSVLVTGGSRGMGLQAAHQLAQKGANVMIVSRNAVVLKEALAFVSKGAKHPESQRFHQVSADLTDAEECTRIIREATEWNHGNPLDIVWCCVGTSHPSLFVDTPTEVFRYQMDTNYFSCVYTAQAIMKAWLPHKRTDTPSQRPSTQTNPPARHLIFTGSFLSLYTLPGYTAYSPSKAAIRSLSDTLSQEAKFYAGAFPEEPRIKVHALFPATILGEGLEEENKIKTDMTKMLEEADSPLKPEEVAQRAIASLERGQELITTDILTRLVMTSALSGSIRGGFWKGFADTLLAWIMVIGMIFVRSDHDSQVTKFGKVHGPTGMKKKE